MLNGVAELGALVLKRGRALLRWSQSDGSERWSRNGGLERWSQSGGPERWSVAVSSERCFGAVVPGRRDLLVSGGD